MTTRTLSVVIPAYNAEASIRETIAALATAAERASSFETEIVLVDDGSTDATAGAAAEAARDRLPLRVVSQPNRGRFEARRTGLDAATGDWVLLLDSRVRLHADALAFAAGRLGDGDAVWNGHVHVRTDGNPYGSFWKVLTEIAWKDYFAQPRTTSFGPEDFDRYPKGTSCFLAPAALLRAAVDAFHSYYADMRVVSDDTALIRWIADRERIHLSPAFACDYEARTSLGSFVKQGVYRGTTFVDGHLRPESRFFAGGVAFFPVSALLSLWVVRRPVRAPVVALAGGAVAAALASTAGRSRDEVRSMAWVAPIYAVAHAAGMWRGMGMLVLRRLRRADTP